MSRLTWFQKSRHDDYTKDPNKAAVLLDALENRRISDFRYALEVMKVDPNLLDVSTGLSVFQTVLQTPESPEFITLCINHGANFYKKNGTNRYPIHYAIKSLCSDNVGIFLRNYDPLMVNVKFGGQNCLHLLLTSMNLRNYEDVVKCIKLLLDHGCSLNMPNNAMKTPFNLILKKLSDIGELKEFVQIILDNYEIDFHTYKPTEIAKMMNEHFPEFKIPPKSINISFQFMMSLLDKRQELDFGIYHNAYKEIDEENYHESCLRFFEVAVGNGMRETVEFLLEKRVDVNKRAINAKYLKPPAFLACANGYYKILAILMKRPELDFTYDSGKQKYSLLHEICQNSFNQKSAKNNSNVDYQKCFDMLLKDKRCDPNVEDDLGCSPLHYTVRYKNDQSTLALLKKGAYINEESNFGKTPIDEISCGIFEKFLNECIMTNSENDRKVPNIEIDFRFLIAPNRHREIDSADKDGYCREISALKRIADNEELRHLVSHPVLSSFAFLKWSKLSFLFYANLVFFMTFMFAFICFIVLSQSLSIEEKKQSWTFVILKVISFVSIFVLLIREIFQCVLSPRFYFQSLINWFEMMLIMLSFVVYIEASYEPFEGIFVNEIALNASGKMLMDEIEDHNGYQKCVRYLRSLLILGASFECFQIVGSLPFLSVSTHMVILKRVSLTFFKSIALYSILPLSFGLVFFMIFSEDASDNRSMESDTKSLSTLITIESVAFMRCVNSTTMPIDNLTKITDCLSEANKTKEADVENGLATFENPGWSILRAFVMLTGEFDATDIKKLDDVAVSIFFTLFVFLVTIVLFNLLNALAVSDTQAIKSKGEVIDLTQRIEVLDSYEKMIFNRNSFFNPKVASWLREFISLFPNTIPQGRIIVRPSRNNEIVTLITSKKSTPNTSSFELLERRSIEHSSSPIQRISFNKRLRSFARLQKYTNMSASITKKIRSILAMREDRRLKDLAEKQFKDDLTHVREQMDLQLRLVNELVSKQQTRLSHMSAANHSFS